MGFGYITPAITKWKLDEFMEVIDDLEDELSEKVHHKMCVKNDYNTILLHIVGKSLVTVREILTLCAHGYSDGAMSLGRNLYEQMMIIDFFEEHKKDSDFQEYVDDFFLSYAVQQNKYLRDINKLLSGSNIAELDKEKDELEKKAHHKLKGDYWWSGFDNFSKIAHDAIGRKEDKNIHDFYVIHYLRYKKACVSLHAGCMGNIIRIGSDSGFDIIDTSPKEYGQSTPLVYSVISLIYIIGNVCEAFNIDGTKHIKKLNEIASWYQEKEKVDIKITSK
ncbi:MAG: hypothetical protein IJO01_01595 [Oscillospiraceae bacterium]|nr:hypothetical protein [Oscillospiraceae bacterium]